MHAFVEHVHLARLDALGEVPHLAVQADHRRPGLAGEMVLGEPGREVAGIGEHAAVEEEAVGVVLLQIAPYPVEHVGAEARMQRVAGGDELVGIEPPADPGAGIDAAVHPLRLEIAVRVQARGAQPDQGAAADGVDAIDHGAELAARAPGRDSAPCCTARYRSPSASPCGCRARRRWPRRPGRRPRRWRPAPLNENGPGRCVLLPV